MAAAPMVEKAQPARFKPNFYLPVRVLAKLFLSGMIWVAFRPSASTFTRFEPGRRKEETIGRSIAFDFEEASPDGGSGEMTQPCQGA